MGSSPPVVIHAPNTAMLAGLIARAQIDLDKRVYWRNELGGRYE